MTPTAIGRIVGEHDTRVWRVLEHYVDEARARANFSEVAAAGDDETAREKGHVYLALFADLVLARVMFVTEGKNHETVARFKEDLVSHGGDPLKVKDFSLDMSKAFIKGIGEQFGNARITFDKSFLHCVSGLNGYRSGCGMGQLLPCRELESSIQRDSGLPRDEGSDPPDATKAETKDERGLAAVE